MFTTEKTFDGYSTCFRQHKAKGTLCAFLHGYALSFTVVFRGNLDEKNWVFDFGGMKRAKTKINEMEPEQYFKWLLDHTVILAEDDPALYDFRILDAAQIIRLRVLPKVGCERFAEYLYKVINTFLAVETGNRVKAIKVTVKEHDKNGASYEEND